MGVATLKKTIDLGIGEGDQSVYYLDLCFVLDSSG